MREMYRTARRQTRRDPQTIPESLGLSQYTRERTLGLESTMLVLGESWLTRGSIAPLPSNSDLDENSSSGFPETRHV